MDPKLTHDRPPELLKSLSNRVAHAVASPERQELAGMLRLTGLLGQRIPDLHVDSVLASGDYENVERVGIWRRHAQNGNSSFVRGLNTIDEWHAWANVQQIEAKGAKLRVVLIGESVARGSLLDPQFNPSLALSMILENYLGKDHVEVVDLARSNLGFGVRELALSAIALQPDAVIIFSGNNWHFTVCPEEMKAEVYEALYQSGFAGMKRAGMEWLEQKVRGIIRDVSSAYRARKIPLTWIVPEFNLGDWRIPPMNAPHLPGEGNREWLCLLDGANEALARGELERAEELARKAAELDQGTSVAAWQVLAECSLRQNDLKAARRHLEAARDAVQWYECWSVSPGVTSLSQHILREEAARSGDLIVDCPQLFAAHLEGKLPGRQIFLDYCHLTVEGIRLAMAASASLVLRAIKGIDVSRQELESAVIAPPGLDAESAFLAAIHNAHWWQPCEIVHHYCSRAVRLDAHMAEIMMAFLEVQTRRAPMLMCAVAGKIAESRSPLVRQYVLHYNRQQLDWVLLDAIVTALKTVGIDARQQLDQLRREEHSFIIEDSDLLDDYYCASSLLPQEVIGVVMHREELRFSQESQESHYHKAYWRESRFVFIGERGCPAELHILLAACPI